MIWTNICMWMNKSIHNSIILWNDKSCSFKGDRYNNRKVWGILPEKEVAETHWTPFGFISVLWLESKLITRRRSFCILNPYEISEQTITSTTHNEAMRYIITFYSYVYCHSHVCSHLSESKRAYILVFSITLNLHTLVIYNTDISYMFLIVCSNNFRDDTLDVFVLHTWCVFS
jgi:hypothetical protein